MAESRQREAWARTASLMALIANTQRDPKKTRAFKPSDFDPFSTSSEGAPNAGIGVLKAVFIDRRLPDVLAGSAESKEADP
jgi:hypothetical protein